MDQDDTFRKLKKLTYKELSDKVHEFSISGEALPNDFFESHGWTKDEAISSVLAELGLIMSPLGVDIPKYNGEIKLQHYSNKLTHMLKVRPH